MSETKLLLQLEKCKIYIYNKVLNYVGRYVFTKNHYNII